MKLIHYQFDQNPGEIPITEVAKTVRQEPRSTVFSVEIAGVQKRVRMKEDVLLQILGENPEGIDIRGIYPRLHQTHISSLGPAISTIHELKKLLSPASYKTSNKPFFCS